MTDTTIHEVVQERYGAIARREKPGCCTTAEPAAIGYSAEELATAGEANLGLGCGNPLALAAIEPGMTVLDLGSGAGFDAFLAAQRVGPTGRVIGVDMTAEMVERARENAHKLGAANVEFQQGMIERLPVKDASVDLVISNCVINLSPDKPAVFRELARVLKPGGRFAISDIVLLKPLPEELGRDLEAYVGCVAGASLLGDYLQMALEAGLGELSVPQIMDGRRMVEALTPSSGCALEGMTERFGAEALREAATAVASVAVQGRRIG